MTVDSTDTRRIHSLLGQRSVSDVLMVVILGIGLLSGFAGFAAHVLWVVSVVVMALGLGYVVANARHDHREAVDRRQDDEALAG
jgi:general stress protein CsbA